MEGNKRTGLRQAKELPKDFERRKSKIRYSLWSLTKFHGTLLRQREHFHKLGIKDDWCCHRFFRINRKLLISCWLTMMYCICQKPGLIWKNYFFQLLHILMQFGVGEVQLSFFRKRKRSSVINRMVAVI